ncbi:hypothetical protein IWX81_001748 [Salinibacterium sp. CAN_S4]
MLPWKMFSNSRNRHVHSPAHGGHVMKWTSRDSDHEVAVVAHRSARIEAKAQIKVVVEKWFVPWDGLCDRMPSAGSDGKIRTEQGRARESSSREKEVRAHVQHICQLFLDPPEVVKLAATRDGNGVGMVVEG